MKPPWVCAPLEEALAPDPARADGEAHLPGLVADALRVGRRVGEGVQPVALVVAEHRRGEGHDHDAEARASTATDHPPARHRRRR